MIRLLILAFAELFNRLFKKVREKTSPIMGGLPKSILESAIPFNDMEPYYNHDYKFRITGDNYFEDTISYEAAIYIIKSRILPAALRCNFGDRCIDYDINNSSYSMPTRTEKEWYNFIEDLAYRGYHITRVEYEHERESAYVFLNPRKCLVYDFRGALQLDSIPVTINDYFRDPKAWRFNTKRFNNKEFTICTTAHNYEIFWKRFDKKQKGIIPNNI